MEGRRGDVRRPDEARALIAGLVLARLPAPGPRLLTWSLVAAWCLLGAVPAATRQPQAGGSPFRFVDVSAPSHLTRELLAGRPDKDHLLDSAGAGIAFLDYDRDGRLDIFMPNGWRLDGSRVVEKGRFALYHGLPDGTFEDVTDRAGVGGDGAWGTGAFVADVDGDGWPDIFVTCFGRNILYRNQGNGTFADIAREAGLESPGWNTGAAFFDADGDGDLDVYIAAYIAQSIDDVLNAKRTLPWKGVEMVANGPFGMTGAPDHFFRNDGHGRFTDATDEAGFTDKALGFGFAVRAADLDGDGLVDVYVANDSDPNYLYRNEGKGHFKEVATWAGCALDEKGASQASMGIALGDVNGDGVLDVFVTNFSEDFATLYAGGPGGIFEDVSRATGIGPMTYKPLKWGTAFADLDNDGDLDVVVANGHIYPQVDRHPEFIGTYAQRNFVAENLGKGAPLFRDASATAGPGFEEAAAYRGLAVGDFDNDGDLDLLFTRLDGPPVLLRNDSPALRGVADRHSRGFPR